MALTKIPSVAAANSLGTSGTPGKYFATSFSAGPMIFGSSGGALASGRTGGTTRMRTPASSTTRVSAAGIPVYGVPGGWIDPDNNGTHGLNERRSVRSVYVGRDFLTELVKTYADSE